MSDSTKCKGVKKNGSPCHYRGHHDGYCKLHKPSSDCSICLESLDVKTCAKTRCNHAFHPACLERWSSVKNSCPLCREPLRVKTKAHFHMKSFSFVENGVTYHIGARSFDIEI